MVNKEIWFDARGLNEKEKRSLLPLIFNYHYTGVMIDEYEEIETWPKRVQILFMINSSNIEIALDMLKKYGDNKSFIFFSENEDLLKAKKLKDQITGLFVIVKDKETMEQAIDLSGKYKYIIISFEGDTNIPLELILAYSQINNSRICKTVTGSVEGWTAAMTMEMGSYAVLLKSNNAAEISGITQKFHKLGEISMNIESLKVEEIKHLGMGDRVCIDTTSKLSENEGILIGSTSSGGLLLSSETHFLPYMDLRPFRVNAGALHSYVWCPNEETKYLSELKTGDEVLAVNSDGRARVVNVGRVKIERRPMLLVKAVSSTGIVASVIVQDDWHIRIIAKDGSVKNSTLLKKGDEIAGYVCDPGRHLGVKIEESILEK